MPRLRILAPVFCALALLPACQRGPEERITRAKDAIFDRKPLQALKEYRLALDTLDADNSRRGQKLRAEALLGSAQTYHLELRDIGHALPVYGELIETAPDSPEALQARIAMAELLRFHYRDTRKAIATLSAAVERKPSQAPELIYRVAKMYFELGDYSQSSLEAQKVVGQFPDSPVVDDALFLQAQALSMLEGRREDALSAFAAVTKRFPQSELAAHALFELGKAHADAGENSQAISFWVKALATHPDPRTVQTSIARVRQRITRTTPVAVGERASAFDRPVVPIVRNARVRHRNSVQAAGGTAEEAVREGSPVTPPPRPEPAAPSEVEAPPPESVTPPEEAATPANLEAPPRGAAPPENTTPEPASAGPEVP
ncbi:MAG: tetratricopeptide repeat protein [Myxococcaceae bacterium]